MLPILKCLGTIGYKQFTEFHWPINNREVGDISFLPP